MQGNVSKKCLSLSITVNPRSSPGGLIVVNFENLHGGLTRGWLIQGRGLIEKVCTLHGAYSKQHVFLHAIIILGLTIYINYNK